MSRWDGFVQSHPEGTFFHRSGWQGIFRDIFGLSPRYLVAERGGAIAGVLPLVFQNSLLFGKALVAAPFCVEGGPLAADSETQAALVQAALAIQQETQAPYIELRGRQARQTGWSVRKDLYATFSRALSADDKENLLAIPRKQRAVVRKTLDSSLVSETPDGIDDVFAVYAESVRNLGTPVFPKRYFSALRQTFGADCDAVVIMDGGVPVSAVLNFYHQDTVLPYYGGGTAGARRNGANDFLYWEVMRRAALKGYRRFDFGRSKAGTGAFAFKKNWGFEPQWLEYEYHFLPGQTMPDKNPLNPKYSLFIEIWKKLPLPIANFIGPWIIRGLG
ncbi:MAG TPA: FemAB family XrtA/PEP-CTERM system-associated protein [Rhizomicrobium sp.]|nr:FemAB family XrtA/PEP-CTERM system-associated protein [Rhizomicrobium sp.]